LAAEKEFAEKAKEYQAKNISQTFHMHGLDGQPARVKRTNGSAELIVTVWGELQTTATVDGNRFDQYQPVRVEFLMARNPDVVLYRSYQLVVVEYHYLPPVPEKPEGGTASR
jgi:ABC-type hemin transport system substrate-binding protein